MYWQRRERLLARVSRSCERREGGGGGERTSLVFLQEEQRPRVCM